MTRIDIPDEARFRHFAAFAEGIRQHLNAINAKKRNGYLAKVLAWFGTMPNQNVLTADYDFVLAAAKDISAYSGADRVAGEKVVRDAFVYDRFRDGKKAVFENGRLRWRKSDWGAFAYIKMLNVRYCPYCNAETVYTVRTQGADGRIGLYKSALDHFLPKSAYPFLALSLTNLVPACFRCNSQLKKAVSKQALQWDNPYRENLADGIRFHFRINDIRALSSPDEDGYAQFMVEEPGRSDGRISPLKGVMKIDDVYNALFKRNAVEFIGDRVCQESAYSSYAFPSLPDKSIQDVLCRRIDDRILSRDNYNERRLSKCLSDVDEDVFQRHSGGL